MPDGRGAGEIGDASGLRSAGGVGAACNGDGAVCNGGGVADGGNGSVACNSYGAAKSGGDGGNSDSRGCRNSEPTPSGAGAKAGAGEIRSVGEGNARAFRVAVRDTGASFACRADEYLLNAMIRARAGPVAHGCCGGGCGVCRMRIVSGEWAATKKMSRAHASEQDQKQGIVLICCVQPRSDLVITRI
ncbi:MAG: 2Fe-2S iron-sulfur cluster binding domain-containing protein [Clostridiales bacterium]|jgi:ferredoxin|nr:2Fe-2S iron-sulfur cluster binding domain-containing protein [Clostridiales bacterium]